MIMAKRIEAAKMEDGSNSETECHNETFRSGEQASQKPVEEEESSEESVDREQSQEKRTPTPAPDDGRTMAKTTEKRGGKR